MFSGGVRVALMAAAPLLAVALVRELVRQRRLAIGVALTAIAVTTGLALSLATSLGGGGEVERTFGTAVPGVDLTVRADSASLAVVLIACLATAAAVTAAALRTHSLITARPSRHPATGTLAVAGLLLTLAGTTIVAVAATLVQAAAGVECIAAGVLAAGAGAARLPGSRSVILVTGVIGSAGLALVAAAAGLIAFAGSSDLGVVPSAAVGTAIAVAWALAGAGVLVAPLLVSTLARGGGPSPRVQQRLAAAPILVPAGFLILLRLQQVTGGSLPGAAGVVLVALGAGTAVAGAVSALRARTTAAAGQAAIAVLTGLLIAAFSGDVGRDGTVLAGLLLGIELALLAAPAWAGTANPWSAASAALIALPGGATAAVALVALGGAASDGRSGFPRLVVFTASLAAAAVAVARRLQVRTGRWWPLPPATVLAVVAGLAGGLAPGFALRVSAPALAGGAPSIDLDAGALQATGAGWGGGYLAVALSLVALAAAAALRLYTGDGAVAPTVARSAQVPEPRKRPHLGLRLLIRVRRRTRPVQRRAAGTARAVDTWLETEPRLAAVVIGAAIAIAVLR